MNSSKLSVEGLKRRDTMLDQIKLDWQSRRRRKIQVLTAATVTSLLAATLLVNYGLSGSDRENDTLVLESDSNQMNFDRESSPPENYRLNYDDIIVKTDPQIADRYLVKTEDIDISRIDVISDEELQTALAEFRSDFGVATIAGKMKAISIRN